MKQGTRNKKVLLHPEILSYFLFLVSYFLFFLIDLIPQHSRLIQYEGANLVFCIFYLMSLNLNLKYLLKFSA